MTEASASSSASATSQAVPRFGEAGAWAVADLETPTATALRTGSGAVDSAIAVGRPTASDEAPTLRAWGTGIVLSLSTAPTGAAVGPSTKFFAPNVPTRWPPPVSGFRTNHWEDAGRKTAISVRPTPSKVARRRDVGQVLAAERAEQTAQLRFPEMTLRAPAEVPPTVFPLAPLAITTPTPNPLDWPLGAATFPLRISFFIS